MKTSFLAIIAVFLLLIPWVSMLDFDMGNVQVDGIVTSAVVVMTLTVFFSIVSWSVLSWASKSIKPAGILLSIITGASLVIPFIHVLGPMAGVLVGVVSGFSAFMLQKRMADPAKNRSVIIAIITIAAAYMVLILVVLATQSAASDAGDGIGSWSGTAEGIEESGFENIFNNSIGFAYFLAIIPSLMATGLILRGEHEHRV